MARVTDEDIEDVAETLFEAERLGFGEEWIGANSMDQLEYKRRANFFLLSQLHAPHPLLRKL